MKWLWPDEAAKWLGVSIPTLRVIAHRERWRRVKRSGNRVQYAFDDVASTVDARVSLANDTDVSNGLL